VRAEVWWAPRISRTPTVERFAGQRRPGQRALCQGCGGLNLKSFAEFAAGVESDSPSRRRRCRGCYRGFARPALRWRQTAGKGPALRDGRHRHGGVIGVSRSELVFSVASAAAGAKSKLCRSNCQTVFAMEKIPSDKLRRARLGRAVPLRCVFDATLAALEQTGVWSRFRRLGSHVLIAFRRHRISAPTSSRYCRFSPLVPIARCLQRWPCEPVARIDLQSRCRPKW
jgi:hypothetical protein